MCTYALVSCMLYWLAVNPFPMRWLEALSYHMAHWTSMEKTPIFFQCFLLRSDPSPLKHRTLTANSSIWLIRRRWKLAIFCIVPPRQLFKLFSVNFRLITCLPCITCTHAYCVFLCLRCGVQALKKACGSIMYMRLVDCWLFVRVTMGFHCTTRFPCLVHNVRVELEGVSALYRCVWGLLFCKH